MMYFGNYFAFLLKERSNFFSSDRRREAHLFFGTRLLGAFITFLVEKLVEFLKYKQVFLKRRL